MHVSDMYDRSYFAADCIRTKTRIMSRQRIVFFCSSGTRALCTYACYKLRLSIMERMCRVQTDV